MNAEDAVGWIDDIDPWIKEVDATAVPDGRDLYDVAIEVTTHIPEVVRDRIVVLYLTQVVRGRRRNVTRQVEQAASPPKRRRPTAEERAEREEEDNTAFWEYAGKVQKIVEEYAAALKVEWTQELLDSGFALPDGTVVTWGTATVADHQQRVEMFTKSAAASIENGARHQQAIDVLVQSGAGCLNDYIRKE